MSYEPYFGDDDDQLYLLHVVIITSQSAFDYKALFSSCRFPLLCTVSVQYVFVEMRCTFSTLSYGGSVLTFTEIISMVTLHHSYDENIQ
jgi:hypothetical protein